MLDFTELFFYVYDFCTGFDPWWKRQLVESGVIKRDRRCRMHLAEITTIIIGFHASGMKCFKAYYQYLWQYHSRDFNLLSYERFVSVAKRALPLIMLLLHALMGKPTEVQFIDSTPYKVCHVSRRYQHKVFGQLAALSKNSLGWFYGMKLHFIFNLQGEIVRLFVSPGNVDDRDGLREMVEGLIGKLFGDRGYISAELFKSLFSEGLQVVTRIKKNMKNILMDITDKLWLKKRMLVESIFSSIKSCGTFEHSRHRSVLNAFCHIFSGLIFYQLKAIKPSFVNLQLLP